MTCRDTERLWNERLDARGDEPEGLAAALDAHAADCPACAEVGARYRRLLAAIDGLAPIAVGPGTDLVERLRLEQGSRPRRWVRPAWMSAAAALIVAGVIGLRGGLFATRPPIDGPTDTPARSLADALADATTATLDLAREASAPVGRVVLASTARGESESPLMLRVPSVVPTSDVLRSVGGRVGAGVRPLSGSARGAFGFLLRSERTGPEDSR